MSSREVISIGSSSLANDGDTLRAGGSKINNNFAKICNWASGDSDTIPNEPISESIKAGTKTLIDFVSVDSAENAISITNAAAGGQPEVSAIGVDTNINLLLTGKGTGSVIVSKIVYDISNVIASGNISTSKSFINFSNASPLNMTLLDGTVPGEIKKFFNAGVGSVIITPSNFANGSTMTIEQNEACEVQWNGSTWFMSANSNVAIA